MTDGPNISFSNQAINLKVDDDSLTGYVDAWDSLGNYIPYYMHFNYTSGMIYSKKGFKNGYFECRFKVPPVKGLNSAFWLFGPHSSEIDVFEIKGSRPFEAQMTLHWENADPLINSRQWPTNVFCDDSTFAEIYQTFAVKWLPNELKWYLNNNEVIEPAFTNMIRGRHIPADTMNIIFTCEAGTLDGNPDSTSVFPAYFNIDYIRVYSKDTTPAPLITGQIPVSVPFASPLAISTGMLFVNDFFHIYPAGFKVVVQPDTNYILDGNRIIPLYDFIDTLYVPVKVNDGIDESPMFQLKVNVTGANQISSHYSTGNISVYPNPADQKVYIHIREHDEYINQLCVYDVSGCILIRSMGRNNVLDVSGLNTGFYCIGILTNKRNQSVKVMME